MLLLVVSAFVIGGALLMMSGLLPEEHADEFRSLADGNMTLQSEIIQISSPSEFDDLHVYAINEVAVKAVMIAQNNSQVKAILEQNAGSSITVAGVQPTLLIDASGRQLHSSAGQVIITANRAQVEGVTLTMPIDLRSSAGKKVDVTQQIWSVLVDLDKSDVTGITKDAQRRIQTNIETNLISMEMNVFLPHSAKVPSGSSVRWVNDSNIPHNVVGTYSNSDSPEITRVDSGFFGAGRAFQYVFDGAGVFEYSCTIHSEEGMKGVLVIES